MLSNTHGWTIDRNRIKDSFNTQTWQSRRQHAFWPLFLGHCVPGRYLFIVHCCNCLDCSFNLCCRNFYASEEVFCTLPCENYVWSVNLDFIDGFIIQQMLHARQRRVNDSQAAFTIWFIYDSIAHITIAPEDGEIADMPRPPNRATKT